jgi:hypothetical protein
MTERLLIEEKCVCSMEVTRTLVVEVPSGIRDHARLECFIREGELDWGPFQFEIVAGTEHRKPAGLRILGGTEEPADIPWREADS